MWKKVKLLYNAVYQISKQCNDPDDRFIMQQILRASLSIPSNIAEAYGRQYKKDSLQFLSISRGSLYKTESIIGIIFENKWIDQGQYEKIIMDITGLKKLLHGTVRYFKSDQLNK